MIMTSNPTANVTAEKVGIVDSTIDDDGGITFYTASEEETGPLAEILAEHSANMEELVTAVIEAEQNDVDEEQLSIEHEREELIQLITDYDAVTPDERKVRRKRLFEEMSISELRAIKETYELSCGGSPDFAVEVQRLENTLNQVAEEQLSQKYHLANLKAKEWSTLSAKLARVGGKDFAVSLLRDNSYHTALLKAMRDAEIVQHTVRIVLDSLDFCFVKRVDGELVKVPVTKDGVYSPTELAMALGQLVDAIRPHFLFDEIAKSKYFDVADQRDTLEQKVKELSEKLKDSQESFNTALAQERARFKGVGEFVLYKKGRGWVTSIDPKDVNIYDLQYCHRANKAIKFSSPEKVRKFMDRLVEQEVVVAGEIWTSEGTDVFELGAVSA